MRDADKAKTRKQRYLERQKIKKFGPEAAGKDMRGRHGNHARGDANARSKGGRFVTSHGYVAVRVPADHPHAWGAHHTIRYAYEHILIAEENIGRPLADNEIVHHKNEVKTDNRWPDNLEVITVVAHAREHAERRGRDELGRFPPKNTGVQEFPT